MFVTYISVDLYWCFTMNYTCLPNVYLLVFLVDFDIDNVMVVVFHSFKKMKMRYFGEMDHFHSKLWLVFVNVFIVFRIAFNGDGFS